MLPMHNLSMFKDMIIKEETVQNLEIKSEDVFENIERNYGAKATANNENNITFMKEEICDIDPVCNKLYDTGKKSKLKEISNTNSNVFTGNQPLNINTLINKKNTKSEKSLKEFRRKPIQSKSFQCPLCEYSCKSRSSKSYHLKCVHTIGESLYMCEECGSNFKSPSNLKAHLLIHQGIKTLACDICDYKTRQTGHLKRHKLAVHCQEKRFVCTECGYKCSLKHQLKSHIANNHITHNIFSCSQCEYSCKSKTLLKEHMVRHTGISKFKCSECSYKCNKLSVLKKHLLIHGGEKQYNCAICDSAFHRLENLKTHIMVHHHEKSFFCNECGHKFSLKHQLKSHIAKMHRQNNAVTSPEYKYSSKSKPLLKDHYVRHTGIYKYNCSECSYKGIRSNDLKKHILIHRKGKQYTCTLCVASFHRRGNLKVHYANIHKEGKNADRGT